VTAPGGAVTPARPDAAPGAPRRARRWLPALGALATIVVIVAGGYVTAAALSEPAGPPVGFVGVVSVRPLSGWVVADRDRMGDVPFVRLTRGSGSLDVVAFAAFDGLGGDLAVTYRDEILTAQLGQLSVSRDLVRVRIRSGLEGLRFAYVGVGGETGVSIEGEVTVVVTPSGAGVVFDGWAPEGLLSFVLSDIRTMVERAEVA
jgi:hypothetical protein